MTTPEPSEVAETTAGERECIGCPPCPGRGNDGHGLTHCAECCFGTGVKAEYGCPVNPAEPDAGEVEATAAALYRLEWEADLYATPRGHATAMYERRAARLLASPWLAAHVSAAETKARAEERAEWSSWLDSWLGAVGPKPPTVEDVARALRSGPRPFGCAASIARGDAR